MAANRVTGMAEPQLKYARKDLHLLDAHEVVAMLRDGHVTPSELIDIVEARVAATENQVHATPITCFQRAREAAAVMKHPVDKPAGYLYGLPILVKDGEPVAGVRYTEGSPLHTNRIAEVSNPLVLQLEARGALVVGKTNVPEFCAGSQSFNSIFPTTVSPWDTRTTAGGSSGGSAAALASCQCWLATGSDLGGSLRTPAAFCGVVGFRVSPGRVPRSSENSKSGPLQKLHATSGPMARCVRDIGLFLDAMEGNDGWDFAPPPLALGQTWEAIAIQGSIGDMPRQIAYSALNCNIAPEVEVLCRKAAAVLAGVPNVHELEAGALDFKLAERVFQVLRAEKFAADYQDDLADAETSELLKPEIRWNASVGMVPEASEMATRAREDLCALSVQVEALFKRVDILCAPATLDAAFDASVRYPAEHEGRTFANYLEWMMPACIVTVMLCPVLVLPCGFLKDGRPIGLQLIGQPGGDVAVMEAAAFLERSLELPKSCPSPKEGSVALHTVGPRSTAEAAEHHRGEAGRFVARYSGAGAE